MTSGAFSLPLLTNGSLLLYSTSKKGNAKHADQPERKEEGGTVATCHLSCFPSTVHDLEADQLRTAFFLLSKEYENDKDKVASFPQRPIVPGFGYPVHHLPLCGRQRRNTKAVQTTLFASIPPNPDPAFWDLLGPPGIHSSSPQSLNKYF